MKQRIWFERKFELGHPADAFPEVLERVRGTPARLEERLASGGPAATVGRTGERWSIREQVGHLSDLEPLWMGRLADLLAGVRTLRAADLTNAATHDAGHDATPLVELITRFREARTRLVERLERLTDADLDRTALHPRLGQPMSIVDLFFFVAEHDDHHLVSIGALLAARQGHPYTTE